MMSVNIIALGKMSEKFFTDAMKEYSKRLSAYCKFNVIEIPEVKVQNEDSEALIREALEAEAKLIAKYTSKGHTIAMCVEGEQMISEKFAEHIKNTGVRGESQINFVIGSSHGLSDSVKRAANMRMSVSKMTLPHQLCRVFLTEQIYRAFKINAGERYHK